jgi:3-oxoacyl-[acyl-carrier-protein] synthase-3
MTELNIAQQFIANGSAHKVVVLGTEAITLLLDYTDRNTCVLFGDGAGASLVEPVAPGALESVVMRSDGGRANVVYPGGPASPRGMLE